MSNPYVDQFRLPTSQFSVPDDPGLNLVDIQEELDLYEKGRMLRTIVSTPAWKLVIQALEDYRDKADQDLRDLPPGDPTVPTAHAAVSALDSVVAHFQQDINHAVDFAAKPSQEVSNYLKGAGRVLDVSKATGMSK